MYKYLKMVAPDCQQRIEECSDYNAKSLIKRAQTNSSQAAEITIIETFNLSLILNYGGRMLNKQETITMGKAKG